MIRLVQLPAWRDNYIYLLVNGAEALCVDPPEAGPVLDAIERLGVRLKAVLNTHHHGDHIGGDAELREKTGCEVIGPGHDRGRFPELTRAATVGEPLDVIGLTLRVLDVHAHTSSHVCYALDAPVDEVIRHGHEGAPTVQPALARRPALFVGDSLFLAGCGRLFEGTADDLTRVMEVYRGESPDALVCCAHEYTASNLRFATHVLPENTAVKERLARLEYEMGEAKSSVPGTLREELATNPFLLAFDPTWRGAMANHVEGASDDTVSVLGALRAAKDSF